MRDESSPIFKELFANGNETVSVTPSAASSTATFGITGVPAVTAGMKNYAQHFHLGATITLDPDAGGNAVRQDQLFKALSSLRLSSPLLGDYYNHQHSRGSVLGLIVNPVSNGYWMNGPARIEVPANTDTDVTLELFWSANLANECFKKPKETAQWVGFFDGGQFEAIIGAESVYGGDYAGAVIKAPTTLRAAVEYIPSPDESIGVPIQWRERQITGGGNQPILKAIGGDTSLSNTAGGAGIFWMCWLSDAAGVGLDGPDGVDNIVSVELPWKGQLALRNTDFHWLAFRRAVGKRVGPVAGMGTTIVHDNGGWPSTIAAVHNGRPSANAQALFFPMIWPGKDFETSKAQRLTGDLPINFSFTTPVSGTHRFVTGELLEWQMDQVLRLRDAMGLTGWRPYRKGLGNDATEGDLRYTRWHFSPT